MARSLFPALSLALTLLAAGPAAALDWPQFRGVNRDGVSAETDLPRSWPAAGPRVVWKRAIGEGYSGISVVGDRLYTMDSDGTTEYVLALEAGSGKEVWRVPAGPKLIDDMGNGPRTTPTLDAGTVYAMGSHGRLLALKAADGASPVVLTIGGIKQYVVPRRAGSQTVALRPDGSVLWTHPGPFSVIASALFIPPDQVYVSGGDDAGAVLMRIVLSREAGADSMTSCRSLILMESPIGIGECPRILRKVPATCH